MQSSRGKLMCKKLLFYLSSQPSSFSKILASPSHEVAFNSFLVQSENNTSSVLRR